MQGRLRNIKGLTMRICFVHLHPPLILHGIHKWLSCCRHLRTTTVNLGLGWGEDAWDFEAVHAKFG